MTPVLTTRTYRFLLLLVAVLPVSYTSTVTALELEDLFKRPDQRAVELLESGQAEAASAEFKDPQWRGVSRYRAGLYQEAMEDFSTAEDAEGLYNHGTAAARAGDYTQSVASLEQALQLAPDDTNIAHNLEIARQLKDMAEDQSQDDPPQDQPSQDSEQDQGEDDSSESEQQGESPDQSKEDQKGDQQGEQGEQSDSDPEQNQDSGEAEQNDGEMNEDESDQSSEQQQDAEELRDMMQQEQTAQQNEARQEDQQQQEQMAATASDSVSEDDQATEQWLRRIPDDASQLLRNKIRLNHLIEYPEVRDMQEPW